MTNRPFPTVATYPLPAALRTPAAPPEPDKPGQADVPGGNTSVEATAEALEPIISAAIARRARQRRYTG